MNTSSPSSPSSPPPSSPSTAPAPSAARPIFRRVALDRLASPEQLDQLLQVTTPRGWIALAATGVVLALTTIWGIGGAVPERVNGHGILIRSGGVFEIVSPSEGRVSDVSIRVGDAISEGQAVVRLGQPELVDKIREAQLRVADLEAQLQRVTKFGVRDAALQVQNLAQQRANLKRSIDAADTALQAADDKIRSEEQLLGQGLITRQTLLTTVQEREQIREKLRGIRSDLAETDVKELQLNNSKAEDAEKSRSTLHEAQQELEQLQHDLHMQSEVTSPYTGRVLEVMAQQGSIVARGQPILSIDLLGRGVKGLEAVIYVPSVDGKKIKPGMEIEIEPSTVRKEEFGFLLGRVTYVSEYPATSRGMQSVLKNDQLVATLSGHDAPYEVQADLIPDPVSVSQYKWSSPAGPPVHIQSGTLASASIVVDRYAPIYLMLPGLRRRAIAAAAPGRQDARTVTDGRPAP